MQAADWASALLSPMETSGRPYSKLLSLSGRCHHQRNAGVLVRERQSTCRAQKQSLWQNGSIRVDKGLRKAPTFKFLLPMDLNTASGDVSGLIGCLPSDTLTRATQDL